MEKKLLTYNRNSARLLHGIPRRWIIDQLAKTFHYCTSFIRNIGANLLTFGQCSNARGIFKRDLHEGVTNERASPCGAEKPGSPSLRNQIACLIQKYIHSSGTSSNEEFPAAKNGLSRVWKQARFTADSTVFRTVKSSRFWRHLCSLYKNYRFHILHERSGQENNKEKKNNLPDFKDCSPFPRFHLRQFRDQLILLVTVPLQFDGGEFCLREWFLKVLSDTPQTSVYICSLSAAETSTERGRNPIINKQISPCMVTYQRAWFDSELINKIKSFFSEYRK